MAALALVLSLLATVAFPQSELVIVRDGGKEYHRPGCEVVRDGKDVVVISRGEAESRKLKAHADCDPSNPRAKAPDNSPAAQPVYVYIDGGTYYHREKCAKLDRNSRRVSLTTAAKKQWPCRVCKPPIRPRTPRT